jgi:hypothetical protein
MQGISFYEERPQILSYRMHCRKSNFLQSSLHRIKIGMALSEIEFSVLDYSLFIKFLSTFLLDAIYRSRMKQQWFQDSSRVKYGSSAKRNRVQKDKIAIVVGRQQRYGHTLVFITLNSKNIIYENTEMGQAFLQVLLYTMSVTVVPNFQNS